MGNDSDNKMVIVFIVSLIILSLGVFLLISGYLEGAGNARWAFVVIGIAGMGGSWFYRRYTS
ncbi:hypothetical protein [Candidatus Nitrosotenuis sp. DW1]|uniref:hypothetical protein n=1 Tax=Candidatus Nitrosotenuis sp. DW1 TaxID=2259672 RepID=UPI0015CE227C|nr:hypothetical protein [Candidatus Nitrosotenuis sp. DW1]QLH09206.1 hypothetical protein DSQ19_06760 [Candidatus Nitrosotenuis sp. DW1]